MSNPTLTKKQQKRSIAGSHKKKLKTVLTQPYQIYWPIISSSVTKELQNTLHKIFDKFTTNAEITIASKKSVPDELRKIFNFGMNSSIRSVRNKTATALLISDEINPKFIARQVITLAISRNENIKILVVPEFKEIFKNHFKISPTMLTVSEKTPNNYSADLQVWINKTAINYPVPATMLLRLRKCTITKECKPTATSVEKPKIEIDFNKLYLFRESTSERVFIPPMSNDDSNEKSSSFLHIMNADDADDDDEDVEMRDVDYIAFKSEEKSEPEEQISNNKKRKLLWEHSSTVTSASYMPLKVNKIQPNPNKKKKSKKLKLNKLSI